MPKDLVLKEKNDSKDTESRSHWNITMRKRLDEGVFILITAISLFILLSLTSYSQKDPGLFARTINNHVILNSAGVVGAYIADTLLCFLGILAYGLPLLATYLAWIRLTSKQYPTIDNYSSEIESINVHHSVRLLGAFLLILGASGMASFEFPVSQNIFPHSTGGIIGDSFSQGLNTAFNPKGTVLLLLAMCFVGVTLLTGLSWIVTAETVGLYSLKYLDHLSLKIGKVCALFYYRLFRFAKDIYAKIGARKEIAEEKNSVEQPIQQKFGSPHVSSEPIISNMDLQEAFRDKSPKLNKRAVSELTHSLDSEENEHVIVTSSSEMSEETQKNQTRYTSYHRESETSAMPKSLPSLPPLSLLEPPEKSTGKGYTGEQLESMAREVEQRLLDFGIESQVVAVNPGPVVTRFELQLAAGVKVSRITGLAKDLARSLSVISVRVVEIIPGKPVIGLELPNKHREMVRLSEVFLTEQFKQARSPISMALGVDISGYPVVVDLAKMPHLLVAGTTGSGKSVGLNAMLLSLLFKATPEEVRLILVDPKMLEFSIYDKIPHLLTPVVTDMKEAAGALRWCVAEMERRYKLMSLLGLRNLAAYNTLIKEKTDHGEQVKDPLWKKTDNMEEVAPYLESLPYIVVVIDELADMMMIVGKKVEQLIARIAQKARAAGIHLILATQRPSVDVLTGLIKSNIPTRIAFQVSSKIDSRTILDQQGADQLLGHGDMLYLTPGSGAPVRIHGAFVDDKEVHRVTDAWRELGQPQYVDILKSSDGDNYAESGGSSEEMEDADPLYDEAVQFVTETRKASISALQRRLKIGYNRSARLIEEMERTGVVTSMESNGQREVLAPAPIED